MDRFRWCWGCWFVLSAGSIGFYTYSAFEALCWIALKYLLTLRAVYEPLLAWQVQMLRYSTAEHAEIAFPWTYCKSWREYIKPPGHEMGEQRLRKQRTSQRTNTIDLVSQKPSQPSTISIGTTLELVLNRVHSIDTSKLISGSAACNKARELAWDYVQVWKVLHIRRTSRVVYQLATISNTLLLYSVYVRTYHTGTV